MLTLAEIDEAVRAGKLDVARRELDRLNRKGLRREADPAQLANLLWRTGNPLRGIRALNELWPEVSEKNFRAHPVAAAEYAACLTRYGAFLEAQWILNLPEVSGTPMARLYQGLAYIATWDYAPAASALLKFVEQPGLAGYWQRIGYANLAATLVYELRHAEARPILRRLLHDSQLKQNTFLLGFVTEVAAADRVLAKDFAEARRLLAEAARNWNQADSYHTFLVEKWHTLLEMAESGAKAAPRLEQLRARAKELQHWETLRECDRYEAIWTHHRERFERVYFGTPFRAYRERVRKDFGEAELPASFAWDLGGKGPRVEVRALIDENERKRAELTSQAFALLALVASDFYRQHRLATLHGWLFPNQHFQSSQAQRRMHESLRRLNLWFEQKRLPLTVEQRDLGYYLNASGPVRLWVPRPEENERAWQPLIVRLGQQFGERPFATQEAVALLKIPRATIIRHLQSLVVAGKLVVEGKGARSRYRLKH